MANPFQFEYDSPEYREILKRSPAVTRSQSGAAQEALIQRKAREISAEAAKKSAEAANVSSKGYYLSSKVQAVQKGMDLADWIKPGALFALGLFFVIGSGLSA